MCLVQARIFFPSPECWIEKQKKKIGKKIIKYLLDIGEKVNNH